MADPEAPPAEPAAPAEAPPAEAAPAEAPPAEPSGTSDALAAARERLAAGKPLTPGEAPPAEPAAGEAPPEPAVGDAPPEEAPPEPTPGDAPPEPTAEEAEAAAAEAAAEPPAETFVVTLVGLENRGEGQIEVEVGDKETYERLNRLNNGYITAQQIKAGQDENAQKMVELAEVEDSIAIDPTGFVIDHIPEKLRSEIAMQLLFQPAVLSQIKDELAAGDNPTTIAELLENPDALRITQAELKASRMELREKLRTHNDEQKAMRANGEAIATEIQSLIPEDVTGSKRNLLFGDAIRDVQERCNRLGLKKLDPRDVKLIVADRFREQGIDFAKPRAPGNGSSPPAAPAPGKPAAAAAAAERTGPELVQARATRLAAAASAPAGAGAPAAQPRPDLPTTTDEILKMARKTGLRAMLGKT